MTTSKATAFLYVLLRDHLPAGVVEKMVMDTERSTEFHFSNPHLEEYAQQLATRLTK